MFKRVTALLLGLAVASLASAADTFEAGKHWFPVEPPQPTTTGDKIEVLEVFSYACPACNYFEPTMRKLAEALPANAQMAYLPASFRADENWPVFQRAYYASVALGIVDRTHPELFGAVWGEDGELRITDPKTRQIRNPMPSIEDVARWFTKFGVSYEDALGTANSFAINTRMKHADAMLKAYGVDSTPTIVVNGKYRLTAQTAGSVDKLVELVLFLVAKESAADAG